MPDYVSLEVARHLHEAGIALESFWVWAREDGHEFAVYWVVLVRASVYPAYVEVYPAPSCGELIAALGEDFAGLDREDNGSFSAYYEHNNCDGAFEENPADALGRLLLKVKGREA